MANKLFPTTVVGSMPRPQYIKDLIEAQAATGEDVGDFQRMMDAAVPYVAQMQELAGIDIISDGEWRRKSYIGVIADICSGFELSIKEVKAQRQTWHVVTSELEPISLFQPAPQRPVWPLQLSGCTFYIHKNRQEALLIRG